MRAKPARLTPPLKWHGGKRYLAGEIIARIPRHLNYVEPFAGGLSVLLARDPEDRGLWWHDDADHRGVSEIINDIDEGLTNFWRVLRDEFDRFRRRCSATPFCEATWHEAESRLGDPDPVVRAWAFFVRCRQSLAGRMDAFAGLTKARTRGGRNEQVNAWLGSVEGLPAVHDRLRDVLILNRDALNVIREFNVPETLFYMDPPYVPETRASPSVYAHEMTVEQHRELLGLITGKGFSAKVMISGYANAMYDDALGGWHREEFRLANHAAGGKSKKRMTEILWGNFSPPAVPDGPVASDAGTVASPS